MTSYTDRQIRRISWAITLILHLALLLFPTCSKEVDLTTESEEYSIPAHLQITKPAPPKPVVKPQKKDPSPKGIAAQKPIPKPEPQPQPGDTDVPIVSSSPRPIVPKQALNEGLSGTVILEAYIDPNGQLTRYTLVQSSGHEILDEAFIRHVQSRYTFAPRQIYGKKEAGRVKLSYTF